MQRKKSVVVALSGALIGILLWFPTAQAAPTCFGKRATIVGSVSIEGTDGPDVIVGSDETDHIDGKGGNDRICARSNPRADEDDIIGGPGRDRINGQGSGDIIEGGGGRDVIWGGRWVDLLYGGPGADSIRGGLDGDRLDGTDGDDRLRGGGSNDRLIGGRGDDALNGGPGIDFATFGRIGCCDKRHQSRHVGPVEVDLAAGRADTAAGTDTLAAMENVDGTPENDVIIGDGNDNELVGLKGKDRVEGMAGNDSLAGFPGEDQLTGGPGDDRVADSERPNARNDDVMDGGPGTDAVVYASGPVTVDLAVGNATGSGDDSLSGFENIEGSYESDTLLGDDGDNHIQGYPGAFVETTGDGDDTLDGRGGTDTLDGGNGTDSCVNGETTVRCE